MTYINTLFAAASILALAGCSLQQPYQRPPAGAPAGGRRYGSCSEQPARATMLAAAKMVFR